MSRMEASLPVTQRLAHATAYQWEGLVLKPCQAPYLSLEGRQQHQVKTRTDMIPGLGDAAGLVVIGSGNHMKSSTAEWWTSFYLACVDTRAGHEDYKTVSSFRIVATVSRPAISIADIRFLNRYGKALYLSHLDVSVSLRVQIELTDHPTPTAGFMRPLVVEVVGGGFDRLPNSRFESLRFPRVVKNHLDRTSVPQQPRSNIGRWPWTAGAAASIAQRTAINAGITD